MMDSNPGTTSQAASSKRAIDKTPSPLELERLLNSIKNNSLQWTRRNLDHYLDQLDSKLFKAAEKAGSNEDQNRYFLAREEVTRQRQVIETSFIEHLEQAFLHYHQGKHTCTDFSSELPGDNVAGDDFTEHELSLVDNRELEETLAVASMSRRRCADNSEQLYMLNQRLAALKENTKITDYNNPIAPGVFGEALKKVISGLTLDETAKLLFYKLFDNSFMSALGRFYDQLNTHLKSNGLLPNLGFYVKKTAEDILADLPDELKNQLSEISVNRQLDLIKAIQVIQHQLNPQRTTARPANAPTISAGQLLQGIQQIQNDASLILNRLDTQQAFASDTQSQTSFRQQIEEQIEKTEGIDRNVIEIVGLLFEYVLNDEQLPDSVKTLLSYLHTPFLKIALLEKDFFNHPDHPARQLLNSLVAAGERWVEPGGNRKSEVFEKIRKIVQRVLQDFDNDVRLFSELAFDFNSFLRQHSRKVRQLEKRARQAAEGENKLREIRQKVEQFIKKKVGDTRIPPTIQNLLFEPWANFLSFNVLRYGPRSEQWRTAASVVEDIVWYCSPHDTEHDAHARARLADLSLALPKALQEGFDTVGYDNTQGQHLLKFLQKRDSWASSKASAAQKTATPPRATDAEEAASGPELPKAFSAALANLKTDIWFEFYADSSAPQRVKLAWCNEDRSQFMFVNRLGQQVAVKPGSKLAEEIQQGKTRQLSELSDKPFFEKAMERALDQLKQRAGGSSR